MFKLDQQLFDLTSYTTHVGKDTTGDLLSKAALLEKARTYLKGLITIERSANGTDSFLGEFGMNLSKAARSVAIPSLEIDQPDCLPGDALEARSDRSTRPSSSTSSRAASHPTRRASSRPRLPRAGRGTRAAGFAQDRLRAGLLDAATAGTDGRDGEAAA